ncbi:hypothetical protein LX32DRAFT_678879 [Colletotrichum zoysiae]|uniref:Uncharacterized protein n=1 Tax=Colletotrichum zoysiae TaxID=1216348 RepID=A0AAD9HUZ4_9PEZI|nr:hypothetical protein LX32DRAFT_678879 [Colletotrichum zoysiae]
MPSGANLVLAGPLVSASKLAPGGRAHVAAAAAAAAYAKAYGVSSLVKREINTLRRITAKLKRRNSVGQAKRYWVRQRAVGRARSRSKHIALSAKWMGTGGWQLSSWAPAQQNPIHAKRSLSRWTGRGGQSSTIGGKWWRYTIYLLTDQAGGAQGEDDDDDNDDCVCPSVLSSTTTLIMRIVQGLSLAPL